MARPIGSKSTPSEPSRRLVTREEAADAIGCDVRTIGRYKASGKYRGFHPDGIYLRELIASIREKEVDDATKAITGDDAFDSKRAREAAVARREVIMTQMLEGETCYVDEITIAIGALLFEFANMARRQSRNIAPAIMAWVAGRLDDLASSSPEIYANVIARFDLATCEAMTAKALSDTIESIGREGEKIVPMAVEKARIAAA